MNKAELVSALAAETELSKVKANEIVDAFVKVVTATLKKGDAVSLVGFGSFEVAKREARVGRNPKTGAEIQIAAAITPKFRAGKALKDAVNVVVPVAKKPAAKKVATKKAK